MRSLSETKERWEETVRHSNSFADLQRAVKFNGPSSPCLAGCRSVCWRAFLLFRESNPSDWSRILHDSREHYATVRDKYLKFIKHPEQLTELTIDPLADDPDSPWDGLRKDELMRAEILQDVRRLPDEPFYHEERIQTMILDILFLHCKLNPKAGGYRQGMHELLAPIVYVVCQDAIDSNSVGSDDMADATMLDMLNPDFVEHDAFALFSKIMDQARVFYEVADTSESERSVIVEKSHHIHEVVLMKVDPELAAHLKSTEILPQIFLIRWMRLLFGREFPFEQLLVLWDTIFAFDPKLEFIDLICVAMLLRIRWTLLEADYSVALQLLLKYPAPEAPHGPHTFVDDAIYLKDHLSAAGGSTLIMKYTGKTPTPTPTTSSTSNSPRPSTPSFQGFGSLRQRTLGARSPLSASARLLQQPGAVDAFFHGAAKGMIERGEKLGINQAVRDAMGEIRRNVQGFQDARSSPFRSSRGSLEQERMSLADNNSSVAVAALERRNRQLAGLLEETIANLRELATSKLEGDREKHVATVEIAAAKVQFVKVHLEDASLALPEEELPAINTLSISARRESGPPTVALDTTPVVMTSSAVDVATSSLSSSPDERAAEGASLLTGDKPNGVLLPVEEDPDKMDTDDAPGDDKRLASVPEIDTEDTPPTAVLPSKPTPTRDADPLSGATTTPAIASAPRPNGPVPTRSSLAQSSFSWMLEPEEKTPTTPSSARSRGSLDGGGGSGSRRHPRSTGKNASRERNAFLFGEVTADNGEAQRHPLSADEIFGLQPIKRVAGARSGGASG